MADESSTQLMYKGHLKGHDGWVTCIATTPSNPNLVITGSRDKTLVTWELTKEQGNYGYAKRSFLGHNHFINDIAISKDGQFVLSGSWDTTLKLWEIETGKMVRTFTGHTKDVMSVAFSSDNRQIVSSGRDKTIKLWNTLGECKFTFTEGQHSDWVSCVRFSPSKPVIVSAGWDKKVKVWDLTTYKNFANLTGHSGPINTVTVSPDGSLCASAGKDGTAMLWDLNKSEHLYSLTAGESINALCFSPNRYWLCAATEKSIKIWDLETKKIVAELVSEFQNEKTKKRASCISLKWSPDGATLFSGYTDGLVRIWSIV